MCTYVYNYFIIKFLSGGDEKVPSEVCIHSTASLLYKFTERIPENIEKLCHILQAIAEKNTPIHTGSNDSDWPTLFSPTEEHCLLCGTLLGQLERIPGSNSRAFLLTKVKMLPVKALIKCCPNTGCLARHSYRTWKEGMLCRLNTMILCTWCSLKYYIHIILPVYLKRVCSTFQASCLSLLTFYWRCEATSNKESQ